MGKVRNMDLPGMENRRISELHDKGAMLEAVRTKRMDYQKQEADLQAEVLMLMEKHKKTENGYHCDGVDIEYIPGEPSKPKIKVRVALNPEATEDGEALGNAADE
jgi:hypothetical protein